ncbi:MAG: hypothetical protein AB7P02_24555, partial [Alphaproteobacteria bacterium]
MHFAIWIFSIAALAASGPALLLPATALAASFSFTFANHLAGQTVRAVIEQTDGGGQEGAVTAGNHTVIAKSFEMRQGTNRLRAYFRPADNTSNYCFYDITVEYAPTDWGWLAGQSGTYACSMMPT